MYTQPQDPPQSHIKEQQGQQRTEGVGTQTAAGDSASTLEEAIHMDKQEETVASAFSALSGAWKEVMPPQHNSPACYCHRPSPCTELLVHLLRTERMASNIRQTQNRELRELEEGTRNPQRQGVGDVHGCRKIGR